MSSAAAGLSAQQMQGLTHEQLVSFVRGSLTTVVSAAGLHAVRSTRPAPSAAACA
jgi:hypothetical protein